jgi:hypothetical protein
MRSCDVCGGIDDHPRHCFDALNSGIEFTVNEAAVQAAYDKKGLDPRDLVRIVRDLEDVSYIERHMDCCREVGCPTGDCDRMPEEMQSLKGNALVEAITGEKVS